MPHEYEFYYHSQCIDETFSYNIDTSFVYIHMFKSYYSFNENYLT